MPNSRLIVSKTKKIYLIANKMKCKKLINEKIINSNQIIDFKEIFKLKGNSFITGLFLVMVVFLIWNLTVKMFDNFTIFELIYFKISKIRIKTFHSFNYDLWSIN